MEKRGRTEYYVYFLIAVLLVFAGINFLSAFFPSTRSAELYDPTAWRYVLYGAGVLFLLVRTSFFLSSRSLLFFREIAQELHRDHWLKVGLYLASGAYLLSVVLAPFFTKTFDKEAVLGLIVLLIVYYDYFAAVKKSVHDTRRRAIVDFARRRRMNTLIFLWFCFVLLALATLLYGLDVFLFGEHTQQLQFTGVLLLDVLWTYTFVRVWRTRLT